MPKCSRCDFEAPNLGLLNKHAAEAHTRRRRRKSKEAPPPVPQDRERALLDATAQLFDAELEIEELDQAAYDRVIAYLRARYGSDPQERSVA